MRFHAVVCVSGAGVEHTSAQLRYRPTNLATTNSINIGTTAVSTNASFFPLFAASSSSGYQAADMNSGLTFNPSTGLLSTTGLTATGAITDTAGTSDIDPAFSTTLLGNPVVKELAGTATVAQINAGITILTGVSTRKIYVLGYDFVATGTPATCTGVLLQDTAGSPVVAASVPVASLTSGTHALTASAQLGAGFGQAGLTASQSLQLKVNGSNCTTMTSMSYNIQYTVQ